MLLKANTSDNIIVLKNGEVAEQGTHSQLVNQNGVYSELWSVQESTVGGQEKTEDPTEDKN